MPKHLVVRGSVLLKVLEIKGNNIGEPITKNLHNEIFEIRIRADKDITRSLYAYKIGKKIIILTTFVKKTEKTPNDKIELALKRLKEWKNENKN
ncbi:type II toxin-antitoxin system RelE/ParE family toxin [Campylobacter sp. JMF_02 ED1]|uniref:type II toxin-antitoxin system RelE/ParE family toxin n=1 Tax=unclassified Campylobacter TaxID=2593542 RepID=UPI0022E9D584|nr:MULTISPECIES: type II toxin-antitoxin system RelE/ParE family toxin [unclassified Campylobacter]MDA3049497.1 type II toxin-antitoxin system RelE/ParE family toxin [Campylobacter sp. JMF_15 NE4]MDA3051076.1 type II toxin-antitoxin system RelE/ParE family toxin [Campylobacter sp. JMF_02 ED1]